MNLCCHFYWAHVRLIYSNVDLGFIFGIGVKGTWIGLSIAAGFLAPSDQGIKIVLG